MRFFSLLSAAAWAGVALGGASTDSPQDVDAPQSGYLPNHNLDPNVVGSSTFGIRWTNTYNTNEVFYAKPLVYTPPGADNETVILVSNQNIVRMVDGNTGKLIRSRTLFSPFLSSDTNCNNIPGTVGITGTPVIDQATDIMYLFAKGYVDGASSGTINGTYKFYALQLPSLDDVPGFPVDLTGNFAVNDPTRYFVAGVVLNRPSLAMVGDAVVGGFGGHCDVWNYTGLLVSVTKTTGSVNVYAMEASPGAPSPQPLDITTQEGGKAGIWQSGMGIAADANRVFFVTGNGQGGANGDVPASGRVPLSTLDQAACNFAVDPSTGALSQTDYFEPFQYQSLEGGDLDFGSSGIALLDPTVFSGGGVERLAVAGGKNGIIYVLNADNLGGFAQGPGGSDAVVQTIPNSVSLFSGIGSYPLEGGYIYYNPTNDHLYAYKMGQDANGLPFFTLAGQSANTYGGKSVPTVTSLNGQPGTGIVWLSDVNSGLVAFSAVPVNGVLETIPIASSGGLTKFTRPGFGDGTAYVTANNKWFGFGTPVQLPLSCGALDFGSLNIGQTTTASVSCTANTAVTIDGCLTSLATFECSNSSLSATVASGATFSIPITWDLTQTAIDNTRAQNNISVLPGLETAALHVFSAASGFAPITPVQLSGTVVAPNGYLTVNTTVLSYGGLVLPDQTSSTLSFIFTNKGTSSLTFTGFAWQDQFGDDLPMQNVTTNPDGSSTIGDQFTATNFPAAQSTLGAGQSLTIPVTFSTTIAGKWTSTLFIWSDGGSVQVLFSGAAAAAAVANLTVSDGNGNWLPTLDMAFGNVTASNTETRQIRLCNMGGSSLSITQSNPPTGQYLTVLDSEFDLAQGSTVSPGNCSFGTVQVIAPPLQPNHPIIPLSGQWTIGTNGGPAQTVSISATVVSRQVGPLQSNGEGLFQFSGCYLDTNGRNLAKSTTITNNTIEACMTSCFQSNFAYAGLEFETECWCGNTIQVPSSLSLEIDCNFNCPGNVTEVCGGNGNQDGGGYIYIYQNVADVPLSSTTSTSKVVSSTTTKSSTSSTGSQLSTSTASTTSTGLSTSSSTLAVSSSSTSSSLGPGSTLNPNEPATIGTWFYIGCHLDLVNQQRTFSAATFVYDPMTLESCARNCTGFDYFGTEFGRECYCGWNLTATIYDAPESDCNTPCSGNSQELCGAGSRLSVYQNTVFTAPPAPPEHVPFTLGYAWQGCYTEATGQRALSSTSFATDSMTVEACITFCSGFTYAGLEYHRECYCGNTINEGSVLTSTSSCSMLCDGNSTEFCGGSSVLDLYMFSPKPSSSSSSSSTSSVSSTTFVTSILSSTTTSSISGSTSSSSSTSSTASSSSSTSSTTSSSSSSSIPSSSSSTTSSRGSSTSTTSVSGTSTSSPSSSSSPTSSSSSSTSTSSSSSTSPSSSSSSSDITSSSSSSASSTSSSSSTSPSTSSGLSSTSSSTSTSTSSTSSSTATSSSSTSSSSTSSSSSSSTSSTSSSSSSSSTSTTSSSSTSSSTSSTSTSSTSTSSTSTSSTSTSSTSTSSTSTSSTSISSSSTSSSTSTSSSSSSTTSPTSSTTSSSSTPASNSATTTSTVFSTSTSSSTTATATPTYEMVGCFSDLANGHALPLLFSNKSVTPELCEGFVESLANQPTPTVLPFFFLEYHDECYGGTAFSWSGSAITSLTGRHACTDTCSGSSGATSTGTAFCGGPRQFNLYVLGGTSNTNWPGPATTSSV